MIRERTVETSESTIAYSTVDLFDTRRYPIERPGSSDFVALLKRARESLDRHCSCQLTQFVRPEVVRLMQKEGASVVPQATFTRADLNPYFTEPPDDTPQDHPTRRFSPRRHGMVRADRFSRAGVIWAVFQNQDLCDFVAAVLGFDRLYTYRDPYSSVNLNIQPVGCEFAWHFDNNDFTVSLGLKQTPGGGQFEYVPELRSVHDENYPRVRAVLDGERTDVRTLVLQPGDLQLFKGGSSLHRVTAPVGGERQCLLLSYVSNPSNITPADKAKRIWGETHPLHHARTGTGDV